MSNLSQFEGEMSQRHGPAKCPMRLGKSGMKIEQEQIESYGQVSSIQMFSIHVERIHVGKGYRQ
jgi:hypothetical protein